MTSTPPAPSEPSLDSAFDLFMNELSEIAPASATGSTKPRTFNSSDLGSGDSQVERLTSKLFFSAYDVLALPPGSDAATIKNQYRKLSALVHPDKCRHPKANDAFLALKEAYDDLQRPDYTDKYTEVIAVAKLIVMKRVEEENVCRQKRGEELLKTSGPEFDQMVREECECLIQKEQEEKERGEKIRVSNEIRLAEARKRARDDLKDARKKKKMWDKKLEERVSGWRSFQNNSGGKLLQEIDRGLRK